MREILIFILIIPTILIHGQDLGIYDNPAKLSELLPGDPNLVKTRSGEAYGTIGSPYVFEEFQTGDIYFSNKTKAKGQRINYDCFNDQVVMKKGDLNYLVNSRTIDYLEFHTGDSSIVFEQVFLLQKKKLVFMQLLYSGESTLYKHYDKIFKEADYGGAYSQDNRYDEYQDEHHWYIKTPGNELTRMKPKKKAVTEALEHYGTEIEQYLKTEKPDLKSDTDLIRLMIYYDGLNVKI